MVDRAANRARLAELEAESAERHARFTRLTRFSCERDDAGLWIVIHAGQRHLRIPVGRREAGLLADEINLLLARRQKGGQRDFQP